MFLFFFVVGGGWFRGGVGVSLPLVYAFKNNKLNKTEVCEEFGGIDRKGAGKVLSKLGRDMTPHRFMIIRWR